MKIHLVLHVQTLKRRGKSNDDHGNNNGGNHLEGNTISTISSQ